MITGDLDGLYEKLVKLAPVSIQRNNAKRYLAFQVVTRKGLRNVVTMSPKGVSFLSEDKAYLDELKKLGVSINKLEPDEGRNKLLYLFTNVTLSMIEANEQVFRRLITETIALRLDHP